MQRKTHNHHINQTMGHSFEDELTAAAQVLSTFRSRSNLGIPASIVAQAKGIAIMHIVKAGMLLSARGGNGVVIARLPDGSWSAPSAIHSSGLGIGHQLGVEVTDVVLVLNTTDAVEAFSKGHNFSVGGNLSFAVGPLGREAEIAGTVKSFAPIFSYSHSKGLFAGMSVEMSSISERGAVNATVYGPGVTAPQILSGAVPRPAAALALYAALETEQ
ncbi:hypothetical protein BC830DRAFT_1108426 [Chytriomyces sp. MP71]|nr:hypothetical protein BC830DRAFT_1108426 [Chytriomyces sp. MP71]